MDHLGGRADPPEGAPGPLPHGHHGGAPVRSRHPARALRRTLSGAPGAVMSPGPSPGTIDPDAFAALICDWCLDIRERDYVLVYTTTLAAPLIRALHRD